MNEAVKQVAYSGANVKFTEEQLRRFWAKVTVRGVNKCWVWTSGRDIDGYGKFKINGRRSMAHRVAWTIHFGAIPGGLQVLHVCDNPPCCNPAHLWLGTNLDNARDRETKGRGNQVKGEAHCRSKLTAEQVADIRRIHATGNVTQAAIGAHFGVTQPAIWFIINRRNWK